MITDRYVLNMRFFRNFCLKSSFCGGVSEVEQMEELLANLGRQSGNSFDLEHVTSDVGGNGHASSPTKTAAALWQVRDRQPNLAGIASCLSPLLATHSWK